MKKNIKVLSLGLVSVALWVADWFLLKEVIYNGRDAIFWAWPSLVTIFAISFLTFFNLINRNRAYSLAIPILTIVSYVVVMPKDIYVIWGGAVFLILMFLFEWRIRFEENSTLHFSIRHVISNSVSVMIYALILILGFNIYFNTQAEFRSNPDVYYERLGHSAARTVPFFTQDLPVGVDFNQTVDQFLSSKAQTTNPSVIKQYRDDFFNQFQIKSATGSETLGDLFGQIAADKIKQASVNYQEYFPFIFSIIVIGLLLSFAFLLRWATQFVSWVLFRILFMLKFFKLTKVTVEVQKLDV